uniref:Uncharacterized protein n=1 Tax=Oryza nivara TaxID=4536 RepID=A0A0E0FI90_ORYNI
MCGSEKEEEEAAWKSHSRTQQQPWSKESVGWSNDCQTAVKLRVEFCRINWSLLADHTTATGSGRQEVMSANSPASVQMVDRFAECPGLSKQQVWRVRPAVVRKKMRRKLTGAMAMPGTDNRSVQAGNESH